MHLCRKLIIYLSIKQNGLIQATRTFCMPDILTVFGKHDINIRVAVLIVLKGIDSNSLI